MNIWTEKHRSLEIEECKRTMQFSELQAELARLRAELAAERERNRWRPISEIPDPQQMYLACMRDKTGSTWVDVRYYSSHSVGWDQVDQIITHWRELPEPPEVQQL